MRRFADFLVSAFVFLTGSSGAEAKLDLLVDKSTQQLRVVVDGKVRHIWDVSTGRDRHSTPNGIYRPERLARMWHSSAYYQSPMPYSIFFHNGYAIHGSYAISQLGGPASHGCVRLHPQHAATLFGLVEQEGPDNTTIVVSGDNPARLRQIAYREVDRPVGSVVDRPPEGLPDAGLATLSRPPNGDFVDVIDRRSYPDAGRRRRVPPPELMQAIDSLDEQSTAIPSRLDWPRRRTPAMIERRPNPGSSRLRVPHAEPIEVINARPGSDRSSVPPPRAPTKGPVGRPRLAVAEPEDPHRQPAEQTTARNNADPGTSSQAGYKLLPKSYWSGAAWRWRP
jgi:hypothetical protein